MAEPFLPPGPNEVEWLGAPVFRGPVAPMKPTWEKTPVQVVLGKGKPILIDEKMYPTSLGAVLAAVNYLNTRSGFFLPLADFSDMRGILLYQGGALTLVWYGAQAKEDFIKARQMMGIPLEYLTGYLPAGQGR